MQIIEHFQEKWEPVFRFGNAITQKSAGAHLVSIETE